MPESAKTVTACIVVIGNEILSGRTRDANIQYLATELGVLGVQVRECRIIPDVEATVVATINEVRKKFDYVFTTGGIGPTHDDITADSVAKAFGVSIDVDPRARKIMEERFTARGVEMNEARLRMARIPAGADLVENKQSGAPGFKIGNVIVMAGVPSIMQAMLDAAAPMLKTGVKMLSETIKGDVREGDIGTELGEIAKAHPNVSIGSYPFFDEKSGPNTNLVIRARDAAHIAAAAADVEAMLRRVRAATAA